MRDLSSNIGRHVFRKIQTKASGSNISTSLIVARPETPLKHGQFIDIQKVLEFPEDYTSNAAIAVEHSKKGLHNTSMYMAFIQNGAIVLKRALPKYRMEEHNWLDVNYIIEGVGDAVEVSLAFDGEMPVKKGGKAEFITEKEPWVFWINESGECWSEKVGHPDTRFKCAENNCVEISAVRGIWSEAGQFNFGLIIFMLLNGSIYYRQYIDGVWYDAAPINFGPASMTYVHIRACRTWDYRICIQAKANDGKMYEMFSQFEGFASRNVEHIEVSDMKSTADYIEIQRKSIYEEEHVELSDMTYTNSMQWGQPVYVIHAETVDNGNGDYGRIIKAIFDHPFIPSTASGTPESWSLIDNTGYTFTPITVVGDPTGTHVLLTFRNFNMAVGECTLHYEPGTIATPVVASNAFDYTFTPSGLDPSKVHLPQLKEVRNT